MGVKSGKLLTVLNAGGAGHNGVALSAMEAGDGVEKLGRTSFEENARRGTRSARIFPRLARAPPTKHDRWRAVTAKA